MKRSGFITFTTVLILAMAGAIYWMQLNMLPSESAPPQVLPTPNGYDLFAQASRQAVSIDDIEEVDAEYPIRRVTRAQQEAWLRANAKPVSEIEKGLTYPCVIPDKPLNAWDAVDNCALLLSLATHVHAARGDWVGALDYGLDTTQVGGDLSRSGRIYRVGLGSEVEHFVRPLMWRAMSNLTAVQCKDATQRLQSICASEEPCSDILKRDKLMRHLELAREFRDHGWRGAVLGEMGGHAGMWCVPLYLCSDVTILSNDAQFHDTWIALVKERSFAKRPALLPDPSDPYTRMVFDWDQDTGKTTSVTSMSSAFEHVWLDDLAYQTKDRLLLAALALHTYKLDHGSYPEALSALAPAYLSAVPDDPFEPGSPFHYRRTGSAYALYSVGPDGKDDGGKPIVSSTDRFGKLATLPIDKYGFNKDSQGDIVAGVNIY